MAVAFLNETFTADQWDRIFGKPAAKPKAKRNRKPKAAPEAAAAALLAELEKPPTLRIAEPPADGAPAPGIYFDVPFGEYLEWKAVNNTLLTAAARSMLHFRHAWDGETDEPTAAMSLGSLVHAAVLEAADLDDFATIMPDFAATVMAERPDCQKPRATNRYRELVDAFMAENAGRRTVTADEWEILTGIKAAIAEHRRAAEYLDGGRNEVSIVWDDPDTGIRCKARMDCWQEHDGRITDLKTTRDAGSFRYAIRDYAYHRQAAFYSDGLQVLTGKPHEFCIVAVETAAPFGIVAATVGWTTLEEGQAEYKRLLRSIAECRRSGCWPGYDGPDAWELPSWNGRQQPLTLNVGGEAVTI